MFPLLYTLLISDDGGNGNRIRSDRGSYRRRRRDRDGHRWNAPQQHIRHHRKQALGVSALTLARAYIQAAPNGSTQRRTLVVPIGLALYCHCLAVKLLGEGKQRAIGLMAARGRNIRHVPAKVRSLPKISSRS
jgi:hypothetical protein